MSTKQGTDGITEVKAKCEALEGRLENQGIYVDESQELSLPSADEAPQRSQGVASPLSFTPGPWTADMHGQNVLACDDQMMICNVRGWGYLTGVGCLNLPDDKAIAIQDANTRLIAAAPALHEALSVMLLWHVELDDQCPIVKQARAALKAVENNSHTKTVSAARRVSTSQGSE